MNPLIGGNMSGGIPPQLMQNINSVKMMRNMAKGDLSMLANQNPAIRQVMQMLQGQDYKSVFMQMCKQQGINPDAILNELQK